MCCINAAGLFDLLHSCSRKDNIMSIWRAMRINKRYKETMDKINNPGKEAFEHQCLNEYTVLCNMANQDQLRMLKKEQLKGYTKWRQKNIYCSPLDFFNK